MTITFENDNDVIVYGLEKIISYARSNQYIFLAQSVWWISSIIGLQEELILHIDKLKDQNNIDRLEISKDSTTQVKITNIEDVLIHPERLARLQEIDSDYIDSESTSISTTETDIHNEVIENCEAFLAQSQEERKAIGRCTRLASREVKRKADRIAKRKAKKPIRTFGTQTEGIDGSELRRRKAAGECQRCAWPQDRKGGHQTLDCFRWKRLEKGTAPFTKKYLKGLGI
jgi:hypothetical protein